MLSLGVAGLLRNCSVTQCPVSGEARQEISGKKSIPCSFHTQQLRGFGSKGEGYFRISAFNSRANAEEVSRRLQELKW